MRRNMFSLTQDLQTEIYFQVANSLGNPTIRGQIGVQNRILDNSFLTSSYRSTCCNAINSRTTSCAFLPTAKSTNDIYRTTLAGDMITVARAATPSSSSTPYAAATSLLKSETSGILDPPIFFIHDSCVYLESHDIARTCAFSASKLSANSLKAAISVYAHITVIRGLAYKDFRYTGETNVNASGWKIRTIHRPAKLLRRCRSRMRGSSEPSGIAADTRKSLACWLIITIKYAQFLK